MCGRYTSTTPVSVLAETFGVDDIKTEELPARFNVAPSQPVYAVAERRAIRQLGTLQWGLVPSWANSPATGGKMINARAETVATKPAYREALVRRRCIIPADAFYEWQVRTDAGRRLKIPYVIRRRDGQPLAFAGLWEVWRPADDGPAATGPPRASPGETRGPLRTCAIITTTANDLLAPIHDRMPVVLEPSAWDAWLDQDNHDAEALRRLLVPAPAGHLELWPVSTLVNNVANDGPELLDPC